MTLAQFSFCKSFNIRLNLNISKKVDNKITSSRFKPRHNNINHFTSSPYMTGNIQYRLMGRPESGYSVKVQSALRYKNLSFEWMDRFKNDAMYQQHAKVPLIPLLFLQNGDAMQDSTPICSTSTILSGPRQL